MAWILHSPLEGDEPSKKHVNLTPHFVRQWLACICQTIQRMDEEIKKEDVDKVSTFSSALHSLVKYFPRALWSCISLEICIGQYLSFNL